MDNIVQLRLRINSVDYIIPTFENTSLQLTRSIQSLDTISSAQKILTEQTFRVPLNKELVEALGDLADPKEDALIDVRKTIDGFILIDGYEAYEGGFTLVSITQNPLSNAREVELLFRGNESSLKAKLEQITLTELFDGETLPFVIDNSPSTNAIKDYYDDPTTFISTYGYTWDLIDYGRDFIVQGGTGQFGSGKRIDDSANPLDQTDFKPSVTIQKVFDMIETNQNLSWTFGTGTGFLLSQIIPLHNNESNLPVLDTSPNDYTGRMYRNNTTTYVVNNNVTAGNQTTCNFNQVDNYNQTVFNVSVDRYTVPAGTNGNFQFRFDYDYTITESGLSSPVGGNVRFEVHKNGVATGWSAQSSWSSFTGGGSGSISGNLTFSLDLVPTDYVTIELFFTQNSSDTTYTLTYTQNTDTEWKCYKSPNFTSSSNVLIAQNFDPDLTAWDVVRTFIAQCNGIVTRDGSTYDITPWTDWIDDNSTVVDLNAKVDPTRDIRIEPTSVKGAKSIRFTYEDGDDFYNEKFRELQGINHGELYIADTGSDFATSEYEIKIPFCNAVPIPISGGTLPLVKMIDEDGEVIKNTPMLIPKASYRRFQQINLQDFYGGTAYEYVLIPVTFSWYDNQNGGFSTIDSNFGTTLNFVAGTDFPYNTLYEKYWRRYIREVYGSKARRYDLSVKITPTEFLTWVMNEKLLFKGAYFRFNSIDNFNLNKREPTKIEMIQRIDLQNSDIAPYYPFDVIRGVVQWKDSSDNSSVGDGSAEPAADIEESCNAYGYYYDSGSNIGIQVGQILPVN